MEQDQDRRPPEPHHPHPAAQRDGSWGLLSQFSAPYQHGPSDDVVLSDPSLGKVLLLRRNALLDRLTEDFVGSMLRSPLVSELDRELMRNGFLGAPEVDDETRGRIQHWWRRGWAASLDYFLWSRFNRFYDSSDTSGDRRRETLRTYIEEGGPPPARLRPEGREVALPAVESLADSTTLGEEFLRRRTVRSFLPGLVPASALSQVFWHGLTGVRDGRMAPVDDDLILYLVSHGVAFDFYLTIYAVSDIEPGIYFYDVERHSLLLIRRGDFRRQMTENLWGQASPESAAWSLILVADFLQYAWRYRHERALRNLYIDAGRVAQELILLAGTQKLGSFVTPALRDRAVGSLLELDPMRQAPVYSVTMGLIGDPDHGTPDRCSQRSVETGDS